MTGSVKEFASHFGVDENTMRGVLKYMLLKGKAELREVSVLPDGSPRRGKPLHVFVVTEDQVAKVLS